MMKYAASGLAFLSLCSALPASAVAQSEDAFYRGKTITIVAGTSSGNDYDFRARLLARHLGKHLPGQPAVIVRNMPGGGGIVATNYLANIAPKDGTVILAAMQNIPTLQALGTAGVKFDAAAFGWIGSTSSSANAMAAWHAAGVKTIEDVKTKELILGIVLGNASAYHASAMNIIAGTKFKIVSGYPGGNELNLALERGEISARSNSFAGWYSTRPDWITGKKIVFLAQVGAQRDPRHPDVPLLVDLASNDADRKVMAFISADTAISRPYATTPGVPEARVALLRRAFDSMIADSAFKDDAARESIELSPASGEHVQRVVLEIVSAPKDVVDRVQKIIAATSK